MGKRESVCVCMYVRERERENVCARESSENFAVVQAKILKKTETNPYLTRQMSMYSTHQMYYNETTKNGRHCT